MFNNADYVPQRAYVQAYGMMPMGDAQFDYAAYVGNSDAGYIASNGDGGIRMAGTDTTYSKLFGGRVGVRYQSLKVGVSGTIDETNMRQLDFFGNPMPIGLGDVDRYRVGVDLSFDIADFFVEGEVISSNRIAGFDEGAVGWSGGISYRPVFPVLLKANFTHTWMRGDSDFTSNLIMVAASISF